MNERGESQQALRADQPYRYPRFGSGPHTFQVLTKRARRMCELINSSRFRQLVAGAAHRHAIDRRDAGYLSDCIADTDNPSAPGRAGRMWPLPNVWLGVSVEDQQRADERIPHLLATSAAVRFLSVEPLLGPVHLGRYLVPLGEDDAGHVPRGVDWVIVGGESGPGARPCAIEWIEAIVEQCRAAGVPVFCKQMGSNVEQFGRRVVRGRDYLDPKGGNLAEFPETIQAREFPR